jgi:hypothetical protein
MKHFFAVIFLLMILFGACIPFIDVLGSAQTSETPSLQIQGYTWNKTDLKVLIVTSEDESWWSSHYLNSTLKAVGQWNDAFEHFAVNYPVYSYVSAVSLEPAVSKEVVPGFDIYVKWIRSELRGSGDEVGLASTSADRQKTLVNCTITLAAETRYGDVLTESDSQNIAVHELGHGLGLGHANYTQDMMYAVYTLKSPPRAISTLDTYGVAVVFSWLLNPSKLYPTNEWLNRDKVVLPQDIPYEYLPASPQNMRAQTIMDSPAVQVLIYMGELIKRPQIGAIFIGVIVAAVIVGVMPKRKKPQS